MAERGSGDAQVVREARVELVALVESEVSRLEERRRDLARARDLLASIPLAESGGDGIVEPLPFEIAGTTVGQLLRDCKGEMRNLVLVLESGPALDEEAIRRAQGRIMAGHTHRTIYPAHAMNTPTSAQWVRSWGVAGEQQRMIHTVPTEFAVFGTEAVVALAKWGDLNSGYAITRHRHVIELHIAYFDELWTHAQPMSNPTGERKEDDQLVEFLGLGLKDEAIARLLGLGLRTIRRRIADLMIAHGVETRYQLGLAIGTQRSGASLGGPRLRRSR